MYVSLGAKPENIVMMDKDGIIRKDRENLHPSHVPFATSRDLNSLAEAIVGADVFLGLSAGGVLKPEMVAKMAQKPLVFALAQGSPFGKDDGVAAARTHGQRVTVHQID